MKKLNINQSEMIEKVVGKLKLDKIINKNMIKKKISNSFIIILIISNIASLLGLVFLWKTNSDYKYTLTNYGFAQGEVGKLGIEIETTFSIMRDIITVTDHDDLVVEEARLNRRFEVIDGILPSLKDKCDSEEEKQIYEEIISRLEKYKAVTNEVIQLADKGNKDSALKIFKVKGNVASTNMMHSINSLMEVKVNSGLNLSSDLVRLEIVSVIVLIVALGLSIALTIVLSGYISNKISDPIKEVVYISKKIAEGNLDVSIEIESEDEIGELASSFLIMITTLKGYIKDLARVLESIENGNLDVSTTEDYKGNFIEMKESIDNILLSLNDVFKNIRIASDTVNVGSEQLSLTSQNLADGSTNQANSVVKLSEVMKEVNNQVDINARSASIANEISIQFVEVVEKSNIQMDSMMSSMENIESCSKDINNIINDINDIAEQTNLLALNAAIEAARAGEAGKGFAVVADEVRKLANKSAEAAKKTTNLIQDSINAVDSGRDIANSTAENLLEVVNRVKESTDLIKKIALASEEQSKAISKMNLEVEQISDIVQSNSAIAEESAAASEELKGESDKLTEMLNQFNLAK